MKSVRMENIQIKVYEMENTPNQVKQQYYQTVNPCDKMQIRDKVT